MQRLFLSRRICDGTTISDKDHRIYVVRDLETSQVI